MIKVVAPSPKARRQVALVLESPAVDRIFEALANGRRREILHWLQDPAAHFPPQEHGDLLTDGACAVFIVQKLGVSQPTASRHLGVLVDAELLIATRRKNWVYYRRNEAVLAAFAKQHLQSL
jgi:DNA-binding transcriptional ArsR family regulator